MGMDTRFNLVVYVLCDGFYSSIIVQGIRVGVFCDTLSCSGFEGEFLGVVVLTGCAASFFFWRSLSPLLLTFSSTILIHYTHPLILFA